MVYGAMVAKLCSRSHGQPLPGVRSAAISSIRRAMSREGLMPASPTRPLGIRSSDSHKRYYGTFTHSRAFAAILPASSPCRSSQRLRAEPDLHAVIGRLDVPRKLAPQGLVVEVGMQVGQDGALGLEPSPLPVHSPHFCLPPSLP